MSKDKDIAEVWEEEFKEEEEKIRFLESLLKALYKKNIVTDEKGNQTVKFSPSELREVVEIEAKIISLKRKAKRFPKELL